MKIISIPYPVNFLSKTSYGKSSGSSAYQGGKGSNEFFIDDWTGYPEELPKQEGPFRILEGEEYNTARNLANKTNANIHKSRPDLKGTQIHEMHPVKFGGMSNEEISYLGMTFVEFLEKLYNM